jgi:Skp family chaperone for outer membrane proteins
MKPLLAAIPLALLTAFLPQGTGRQTASPRVTSSIGYVSAQRILAESTEGKNQVVRMLALQQQKTTDLRAKQQSLDATRHELAQATDASARSQLQQQEQQQRIELERATGQAQVELQTSQRQAQADLLARVKPVVEEVARAQNIHLVLTSDVAVLWAEPDLDLTTAVVGRLNTLAAGSAPAK